MPSDERLFYKSPERIWRLYSGKDFSVRGWRYLTGRTEYEKKSPYEFVRNTPDLLIGAEESELLFFDAVFHCAPCAVKLVAESLRCPWRLVTT
jgi:hypothetical protein